MKLPQARTKDIIEQDHNNETLIYDLTINKAFNLNETSTIVYKACGENATFDDLKQKHKFTDDFILLALDELKRNNLLAEDFSSPFESTSRRELIKKVGLTTMFALPIITGLVAPSAMQAASGQSGNGSDLGEFCDNFTGGLKSNGDFCRSGVCTMTYNGGEACCHPANGMAIKSGQTFSTSGDSDSTFPFYTVVAPNEPAPTCAAIFRCCNTSQASYGTCSYYNQTLVEEGSYTGYYLSTLSCTCSCP